jgi:hypothetical protein
VVDDRWRWEPYHDWVAELWREKGIEIYGNMTEFQEDAFLRLLVERWRESPFVVFVERMPGERVCVIRGQDLCVNRDCELWLRMLYHQRWGEPMTISARTAWGMGRDDENATRPGDYPTIPPPDRRKGSIPND